MKVAQLGGDRRLDPTELGRLGEELAARYLEERGWTVLARNLREGRRELDLVARRRGVLAVVEVKTRRGCSFGHPLEAITVQKKKEISVAARGLIRRLGLPARTTIRFDAVAILWEEGRPPRVLHVPDAWRLG
ncbi:YraN family protein [Gemmatimonadota bacterium]